MKLTIITTCLFLLIPFTSSADTEKYPVLATCYFDRELSRNVCKDNLGFKIDASWISRTFERKDGTVTPIPFTCNKKLKIWSVGLVKTVSKDNKFSPYTYLAWVPRRDLNKKEVSMCRRKNSSPLLYQPETDEY